VRDCLSDPAPARKRPPPAGSLGDLVARADGLPIYCSPASTAVRPALTNAVIDSFRRDYPNAVFVHALSIYHSIPDWKRRWPSEREHYGAVIVVTRAENLPEGTDHFAGLSGEHAVNLRVGLEIETFVRHGRPVAWHAVVLPASYWISRFVVRPANPIGSLRFAVLAPADETESFRPAIYSFFGRLA